MDPQLVVLTETLEQGIAQHKESAGFYRAKGEGFEAAQAENKQKTDEAIVGVNFSVVQAVTKIGKNHHKYYVNSETGLSTNDGSSSGTAFKYIRDALLVAPYGGVVEIVVPNDGEIYFSDPNSESAQVTYWYGSRLFIRSVNSGYQGSPNLKFASVELTNSSGDKYTIVSGVVLSCVLAFAGVVIDSGELISGTTIPSYCIRSYGFLNVTTFQTNFKCGDIPVFDSHIYGVINFSAHSNELLKKPNASATLLFSGMQRGRFDMFSNFMTVEGAIEDYFKSTSHVSATINSNIISGNQ